MAEPIDLRIELAGSEIHATDFAHPAYWIEDRTPKYTFTKVIAPLIRNEHFVVVVARDFFDKSLAAAVVTCVRNMFSSLDLTKPVQLLSGFHHPGYSFDQILLLGPEGRSLFKSKVLESQSLQAAPAFTGEFSGHETPELVSLIQRKNVSLVDWHRSPSPQVWFLDPKAKLGSKRGLMSKANALREIDSLNDGGGVELENYRGDICTLRRVAGQLMVSTAGQSPSHTLPSDQAAQWLDGFLTLAPGNPDRQSPLPPLAGEHMLEVFLSDYARERDVPSSQPLPMSLIRAVDEFDRLSQQEGCFIGFWRKNPEAQNKETMQLIWNEDGTLTADIPFPEKSGSLQRTGSREQLRPLIQLFATGTPIGDLPDFRFETWP